MSFVEAIRLALTQLRVQKLKSFFSLVGVTIGVMFLIAVVAVVNGMARYVEQDFAAKFLGVNTFILRRFPDISTGDVTEATWREWQRRPWITIEDADAVHALIPPSARWAIQDLAWSTPQSAFRNGGPQSLVMAVTADYFTIKNLKVDKGRLFTEQEDVLGAPVIVIGSETADHFFPNLDPIGRELKLEGLPFRVIGVLEKQGSVFGLSFDRQVIGPFHSPIQRVTHARRGLYGVIVQAPTQDALTDVRERVRELMRRRRHLHPAEPDNFYFESSETALADWKKVKAFITWGGMFLPAVGLVVGAIVIMNIMLVAVAERTREIGIRKSLGARRRDILAQFLVESATISVLGAAFGIALGVGLSSGIAAVSPLPSAVALWSILVSLALGMGVGIAAGVYPASRAARLDPIAALRVE